MLTKLLQTVLLGLLIITSTSCVDTTTPLDPNQRPPGENLLEAATPPARCAIEQLAPTAMDLQLHVIDVGQGDALLLRTPDDGDPSNATAMGLTILIDAGNLGELGTNDGARYVADWFEREGIERIDYAIVTHAHADHFGGMFGIFERFDVENVVDPGYDPGTTRYREYLAAAEAEVAENGGQLFRPPVPGLVTQLGDELMWGDELTVRLLAASDRATLGERDNTRVNNTSIVIHIEYNGTRLLLMGDAEEELEASLVNQGVDLRANILKVGHHGSSTSSSNLLLSAVWPDEIPRERRLALISSGRRDFNGAQLPSVGTVFRLRRATSDDPNVASAARVFSTEFGDEVKSEEEAAGDDNIVTVVRPDGTFDACFVR